MTEEIITDNPSRFESLYGSQYRLLFVGWAETESPFRNRDWLEVLLPNAALSFEDLEFAALADAAKSMGDVEFAATTMNSVPEHAIAIVGLWDQARATKLEAESQIDLLDYAILGKSARWGAVAYYEGFTRVSGDAAFMTRFLASLNGVENARRRFQRYAEEEWRHVSADYKRKVMNSIGW